MTVHFIGAGPGAADLITVRGRDILARCPVCLYAGSLVPPNCSIIVRPVRASSTVPPWTSTRSSANTSRPTPPDSMSRDCIPGTCRSIARWRTVASAAAAWDSLHAHTGVPAFAAAAAVLGRELTVPGIAQSVVLTRMPGRASRMPNAERLSVFAATGATLAIHLAIHAMDAIVGELLPHYGADCPVAVVMRASWPDERVLRGTLDDIRRQLTAEPMERTALVFVGRALQAADFEESALYSPDYRRRFRNADAV